MRKKLKIKILFIFLLICIMIIVFYTSLSQKILLAYLNVDIDNILYESDYYYYKYNLPEYVSQKKNYRHSTIMFYGDENKVGIVKLYYKDNMLNNVYAVETYEIHDDLYKYQYMPIFQIGLEKYIYEDDYLELDKIIEAKSYVVKNDNPMYVAEDEYNIQSNVLHKDVEDIYIVCGKVNNIEDLTLLNENIEILFEKNKHGVYYFYGEFIESQVYK